MLSLFILKDDRQIMMIYLKQKLKRQCVLTAYHCIQILGIIQSLSAEHD